MSKFSGFVEKKFQERCEFWATTVVRYDYLRARDNAFTIHFEKFAQNPPEIFEGIYRYIEAEMDGKPKLFAETTMVHPLNEEGTRRGNPYVELRNRQPGQVQWTKGERHLFISICGESMDILGYSIPF